MHLNIEGRHNILQQVRQPTLIYDSEGAWQRMYIAVVWWHINPQKLPWVQIFLPDTFAYS